MTTLARISLPYHPCTSQLFAAWLERPFPIFLDSCSDLREQQGKDIVCADPEWVFVAHGDSYQLLNNEQVCVDGGKQALEKLLELEQKHPHNLLGYFGYHCRDQDFGIKPAKTDKDALPDICIGFYSWCVEVNHQQQTSELLYLEDSFDQQSLNTLLEQVQQTVETSQQDKEHLDKVLTQSSFSKADYQKAFDTVKRYIRDGDCYQVNLAQTFQGEFTGDTWNYYQHLRQQSPAPFACYFSSPYGEVLSFSPESFISVDSAGKIISQPIKGTRKRSSDISLDKQEKEELAESTKDRAENLMIVDLIRNDISKNAQLNTVQVEQLFDIQSFANVHHMVSTISAQKNDEVSHFKVLLDCFPGGSITGAPKKRAMEIIHELEKDSRQVYCGAIGYLSADRNMEFNIAIRTIVISHGKLYCWGGGGLVADSDMEAEYQESINKISNLIDIKENS